MQPPLRATRGAAFYLVASAFTCRVCSAHSCNSLCSVMGGGQSTAHSSTICFYYTTINFFCQVFYTTFLELFLIFFFASVARSTDVPLRVSTAPSLRAALWFSRLRRLNSALSKRGIPLLSFRPITPHIRDVLFSLLFLCLRLARLRLCFTIFGNFLYRFW